jgi:hypothetical protein
MKLAEKLSNIVESKTQDALDKALASIDKNFGSKPKSDDKKVSKEDSNTYLPALKTWIFDYQDKNKNTLAKMLQRKIDKGEYTEKRPSRLVSVNDRNRPEMVKNFIKLYSKAKDKDVKTYLRDYLSEYSKLGYLDEIPPKTRKDITDIWPSDIK